MAALDPAVAERVRASIARQTLLTTLGVEVVAVERGGVALSLPRRDDLGQQHGYVHAGAIATLADSACGYAAATLLASDRDVLTVGFTINLLRPAVAPVLVATGKVVRAGRTITVCTGEVRGAGDAEPIAVMQATIMAVTTVSEAGS